MNIRLEHSRAVTQRHFLRNCNTGLGAAALGPLMGPRAFGAADPLAP